MNKVKRILLSITVALGFSAPALVPAVVMAQDVDIQQNLNCGADFTFTEDGGCLVDADAEQNFDNLIRIAINLLSIIIGVVAVVMIIIGGFKYITSNGDSGAVSGAKNTILYAVVGLVIVALAQVIVRFVLNETTEVVTPGAGVGGGGGGGGNLVQ